MIKRERGALTFMSQEINGISRNNYAAGRMLVQTMDEKLEKALSKSEINIDDMER